MIVPNPTRIYRLIHVDNLKILLNRKGIYAPLQEPLDGEKYRPIHDEEIQKKRSSRIIPCDPGGCLHDYVPFYFGILSPMLFRLSCHEEGQKPIIYLVSRVQDFSKGEFVFSDGHGIKKLTKWYNDLSHFDKIAWDIVNQKFWKDNSEDNDRQRKKQAEFLVHNFCCWSRIRGIVVFDKEIQEQIEEIFNSYPTDLHKRVVIMKKWYY